MKPEFFPYFWIIYVNYVLYKRYKENKHLKKYEIICKCQYKNVQF